MVSGTGSQMKKNIIIILILIFDVSSQQVKSGLLDTANYNWSTTHLMTNLDMLLRNVDLRHYSPDLGNGWYGNVFRMSFCYGEECRPMAIEIAIGKTTIHIIHKLTTGKFVVFNNIVFPAGDGLKSVVTDNKSLKVKKLVFDLIILFNNFKPDVVDRSGTKMYHVEYTDIRKHFYLQTTLYPGNGTNVITITHLLKEITNTIPEAQFADSLAPFKEWAVEEY
jgi:hypothetical protein